MKYFKFLGMKFQILICLLLLGQSILGQNPIIRDIGMSDPHIRVFNDTIYLYSGHDNHPDDTTWVMKDWRVFSTTDLINWNLETTILPKDNYMDDNSQDCWAGDAATRNGKYYFYFSDRTRGIGVMTSDTPGGPFKDALGKSLVSPMHDPTAFIDDDQNQTPYIVYGDKEGSYHVAELNDNMISLAEAPQPITINGQEWNNAPIWMDKNYIFKYNGTFYLSWGRDYATSNNIYGPYQCAGEVGNGHHLDEFAHGSFFWWKGQFYHIWCYYLISGYKYRECIITYCHFDDEGQIVTDTDFLDKHFAVGMGQYDASWTKIQAEWYYEKSETIKKQDSDEGGFELMGIENGSWVKFANMNFSEETNMFLARLSDVGEDGNIEIRLDNLSGPVLGEVVVSNTDSTNNYITVSCELTRVSGKRDLYLIFTGNESKLFNIDWFKFSK